MSYSVCPHCGYPNKPESKICGFCRKSLRKAGIIQLQPFNHSNTEWQSHSKRRTSQKSFSGFSFPLLNGIVGGSLFSVGGYLFYLSVISYNFKLWLISLLGVLYGLQLLRPLLRRH